jgi:hypothetical protein
VRFMAVLGSSGNSGKVLPGNRNTQFSRSEISVFEFSVPSRIAVTTYPGARLWMRSDECCLDCVERFLETMIRKRRNASSRQLKNPLLPLNSLSSHYLSAVIESSKKLFRR